MPLETRLDIVAQVTGALGAAGFDANDQPMTGSDGISKWMKEFDNQGNEIRMWYLDEERKPLNFREGIVEQRMEYNQRRQPVKKTHFNVDGELTLTGHGYAGWARAYDRRGLVAEETFLGTDGAPTTTTLGYTKRTRAYDKNANLTEISHWGPDGEPVLRGELPWEYNDLDDARGVWRAVYTCDQHNRKTNVAFQGVDGKPIANHRGVARATYAYYDKDQTVTETIYAANGDQVFPVFSTPPEEHTLAGGWVATDIGEDTRHEAAKGFIDHNGTTGTTYGPHRTN